MGERKHYQFLDHFTLKILAIILMTIDHIGFFFVPSASSIYETLRIIGRLALPLFCFLSTQGALKSSNPLKYFLKLFSLGIIFDVVLYFVTKQTGNSLTCLGLGVLTVYLLNKKSWLSLLSIFPISIMILSDFSFFPIRMDNGFINCFLFIFFYLADLLANSYYDVYLIKVQNFSKDIVDNLKLSGIQSMKNYFSIGGIIIAYSIYLVYNMLNLNRFPLENVLSYSIESFGILALIPIFFYNGEKGYSNKILNTSFYLYYPLHILIMYLILALIK